MHFEVLRRDLHRGAAPAVEQSVPDSALQVQVERVTELVLLRVAVAFSAGASHVHLVLADSVALYLRKDVLHSLLADSPDPLGRQLQPVALPGHVAGLLQHPGDALKLLQVSPCVVAEKLLHLIQVQVIKVASACGLAYLALQLVHALKLPHQLHGLVVRERVLAEERIAVGHLVRREHAGHGGRQLRHLAHCLRVERALHKLLELLPHLR